jgi:ribonucleotide monophosphatase NagD (HAD superfamily)
MTFCKLNIFSTLLADHPLLVLNPAKVEKVGNATPILAPGKFANVLQFSTDAKTLIPAKPTYGFYIEACKVAGFCPSECLIIGDVLFHL